MFTLHSKCRYANDTPSEFDGIFHHHVLFGISSTKSYFKSKSISINLISREVSLDQEGNFAIPVTTFLGQTPNLNISHIANSTLLEFADLMPMKYLTVTPIQTANQPKKNNKKSDFLIS